MPGVYSRPTYGPGSGTADAPHLGAIVSNLGRDETTDGIIDQIKKDAATNGLSQWGFAYLQQFGEPIKPEWLKESSREWYNKPRVDWMVPPKDDFLKIVEPAVMATTKPSSNAGEGGVMSGGILTQAIRDKAGFGGLWEKYHKEAGDLEQQYSKLPAYLDPKRIADKAALYDSEGRALPGTPQTPSLRAQAEADAQKLAADQASYRAANSYQTIDEDNPPAGMTRAQARQRNRELNAKAEADFRAGHLGANDVLAGRTLAATPPGSPLTPIVPNGQTPTGTPAAATTTTETKNFLPSYLQPGQTQGNTSAMLDVSAPAGSWDTINNGVANIPGQVAPAVPAGSPMAPFVPQGVGQVPGQPIVTGTPRIGTGGFASTAKLLELPYYLRQFGASRRRTGQAAYG